MSTSSSGWSYAAFLTAKGNLLTWNPLGGLTQHSSQSIFNTTISNMSDGNYSNDNFNTAILECTTHPQEILVSLAKDLHRIDLRSKSSVLGELNMIYTGESNICSIKQHSDSHLFMMGTSSGGVKLIDNRYTKIPIAERVVPEPHSELKFIDITCPDSEHGIFIGGSSSSRMLYMHNIELSGKCKYKNNFSDKLNGFPEANGLSTLLSAASSSGIKVQ